MAIVSAESLLGFVSIGSPSIKVVQSMSFVYDKPGHYMAVGRLYNGNQYVHAIA